MTNWRARGGCRFEPQQRRCIMASNKYLINCLVLVQTDFEINKVLNSIIIVRVGVGRGGWGGVCHWMGMFGHFRLSLRLR